MASKLVINFAICRRVVRENSHLQAEMNPVTSGNLVTL